MVAAFGGQTGEDVDRRTAEVLEERVRSLLASGAASGATGTDGSATAASSSAHQEATSRSTVSASNRSVLYSNMADVPVGRSDHPHRQVELGGAGVEVEQLDGEPVDRSAAGRLLVVDEHRLEDRAPG